MDYELLAKIRLLALGILFIASVCGGFWLHYYDYGRYDKWDDVEITITEIHDSFHSRSGCYWNADIEFSYEGNEYQQIFTNTSNKNARYCVAHPNEKMNVKVREKGDAPEIAIPDRYTFYRWLLILVSILLPFYTGYRVYQFKKEGLL